MRCYMWQIQKTQPDVSSGYFDLYTIIIKQKRCPLSEKLRRSPPSHHTLVLWLLPGIQLGLFDGVIEGDHHAVLQAWRFCAQVVGGVQNGFQCERKTCVELYHGFYITKHGPCNKNIQIWIEHERTWWIHRMFSNMDKPWCLITNKLGFHQNHFDVSISYWPTKGSSMFAGYILHCIRNNAVFTQKSCLPKDTTAVVSQCALVRIQKSIILPFFQVSLEFTYHADFLVKKRYCL